MGKPWSRIIDNKTEVLSGVAVSFAMVPEVVAFAFVAGVNPLVGLYAAFIVGLITSLFGGRPGMVSGAAGSIAVVSTSLVAKYGAEYLFGAVLLMGLIQIIAGALKWGQFVRMVPHPVILGFVNGLAIVIFKAQLEHFKSGDVNSGHHWLSGDPLISMSILVVVTMAVTYILPKLTKAIPSSLVAIAIATGLAGLLHLDVKTVGDLASVHGGWPQFHIPAIPYNIEALKIILPYSIVMAMVGLTESLLTLSLVDQLTETRGEANKECIGLGVSNTLAGLFSGMGGCAMIGQSVMNITSGGRKRLSGVTEALCILSFILFASNIIEAVPMAALVGVMFIVVINTFAWSSLKVIRTMPRTDAFVLVLVSFVTVATNLAIAVLVGVIVSALSFAWANAPKVTASRKLDTDGHTTYRVKGMLFFASVQSFNDLFSPNDDSQYVTIDLYDVRLFDHSALEALRALIERYAKYNKHISIVNPSPSCHTLLHKAGFVLNSFSA